MRKLVAEGGWMQRGFNDIGWSDVKKCRGCNEERHREAQAVPLPVVKGGQTSAPRRLGKVGAKSQHFQRRLEVAKRSLIVRRWESDKHKSWSFPVGGFRNHVATDGALLGRGFRQVKRMRQVGGAAGSQRAVGTNVWDVRNAGCGA